MNIAVAMIPLLALAMAVSLLARVLLVEVDNLLGSLGVSLTGEGQVETETVALAPGAKAF